MPLVKPQVQLAVPLPGPDERLEIARTSLATDSPEGLAEAKLLAWVSEGFSGSELVTLCRKYRKRLILSGQELGAPFATIAQLAVSTSVHTDRSRILVLTEDEAALTRSLVTTPAIKFSHSDLAHVLGVSTKTVSRRLSEVTEEGVSLGQ